MRSIDDVSAGQFYRHYSGKYYVVLGVALDANHGGDPRIFYRAVGNRKADPQVYHHTDDAFLRVVDGIERFTRCELQEVMNKMDPALLEGLYLVLMPGGVETLGYKGEVF